MSSQYYKHRQEFDSIKLFVNIFFAVFLAGFILLLVTRWYIRSTMHDVKDATDVYLKHRLESRSKN